jgi:hypothetical protein
MAKQTVLVALGTVLLVFVRDARPAERAVG